MGFFEKVKDDAGDVSYRVAAKQMSKGVKKATIKLMKDRGVDNNQLDKIIDILDSEAGEALISVLLGYGLTCVPKINKDPRAERLANEFRVGGISTAGKVAMDVAFEYFLAPINNVMENLPEGNPRVRIRVPDSYEEETFKKYEKNREEKSEEFLKK